jgi:hypothetical protein
MPTFAQSGYEAIMTKATACKASATRNGCITIFFTRYVESMGYLARRKARTHEGIRPTAGYREETEGPGDQITITTSREFSITSRVFAK